MSEAVRERTTRLAPSKETLASAVGVIEQPQGVLYRTTAPDGTVLSLLLENGASSRDIYAIMHDAYERRKDHNYRQ